MRGESGKPSSIRTSSRPGQPYGVPTYSRRTRWGRAIRLGAACNDNPMPWRRLLSLALRWLSVVLMLLAGYFWLV